MKKFFFFIFQLCMISVNGQAFDQQIQLNTPRGSMIKIDIYNPGKNLALLLAPGQDCNPRLDLYDSIAAEAKSNDFTLVRLYWSYCVANPQHGNPADDLSTEKQDFLVALDYIRNVLNIKKENIFIGGKSLGTFVSYDLFHGDKEFPGLVLLTPVCTDAQTDPQNHKNIFEDYYSQLKAETRPVLLAQGNEDPFCNTVHFQDYLKGTGNNFVPLVIKGNHGFGIDTSDGQISPTLTEKNLKVISKWIFSWLK